MTLYSQSKSVLQTAGVMAFITLLVFIVPILFTVAILAVFILATWGVYLLFKEYNEEQENLK